MTFFDALRVTEQALNVHRYRSEVAGQNLANAYTDPNYQRRVVNLAAAPFGGSMQLSSAGGLTPAERSLGAEQSVRGSVGGVRVAGLSLESSGRSERAKSLLDTQELMRAKSAYELNVRVATTLRSMAQAGLQIGRQ